MMYFLLTYLLAIDCFVNSQVTFLDSFIKPYRLYRSSMLNQLYKYAISERNLRELRTSGKLQEQYLKRDAEASFPCDTHNTRSQIPPSSVHMVRPGDIDIIAAIGDSLTAGNGLLAADGHLANLFVEHRGAAYTIGGEKTWREYTTLPNILKQFNPHLIGYSLRHASSVDRDAQFNVAEAGAISADMPYMARVLLARMRADPRVNITKHWKMITISVGPNDFCSEICYAKNPKLLVKRHEQDMIQVLRLFKEHLPRTIVNVIPALGCHQLREIQPKPFLCYLAHLFECSCLFSRAFESRLPSFHHLIHDWQQTDIAVTQREEFRIKEDFAVIAQTFTIGMELPTINGTSDLTYFSADCFHFSQKGHAALAYALWRSILQPVGMKDKGNIKLSGIMSCPTSERPYIFTNENSKLFRM